jgi:hypothetical protein
VHEERTAIVGDNYVYILSNVYLECWFSNKHVFWQRRLSVSLQEHIYIDHRTYLGFGLLEAPREHILHGPLLSIYWLWLCPHFGAPTLLRRRLFIVLMTAAHISPNVFSLQLFLASVYWTSCYNIQQCMHTYYTLHSHIIFCITLYYTIHSYPSCIFISYALHGRLVALGSLCPIQGQCSCYVSNSYLMQSLILCNKKLT